MKITYLSYSQISCWLACAKKYALRYGEKVRLPVGVALPIGSAVHAGAAYNLSQKIDSKEDLDVEKVGEFARHDFIDRAASEEIDWDGATPDECADLAWTLAELHTAELAPQIQPLLVEHKLSCDLLGRGWDLLGYVDLVDESKHIVDLKTAGRAKSSTALDTDLQLTLYSALWRATTGTEEAGLRHDVLIKPTKTRDARTQQVLTTRTEAQLSEALTLVGNVADAIEAECWPANPGQSCGWCEYRKTSYCNLGGVK